MKRPLAVLFGVLLALLIVLCVTPAPRSVRASVDEVFGQNGTPAATYVTLSASFMSGSVFTTAADMNAPITDGHFYGRGSTTSGNVKFVIALHSTLVIVANGISNPVAVTTTAGWWTATWTTAPTLSPSTAYVLLVISNVALRLYDYDLSALGHHDTSNLYSAPTDPTDATHVNHQYCIYCHYTPNNAPVNVACYCTNLDDGDNLYARMRLYTFNCTTSDADGYANIATVTLGEVDSPFWEVQYNEDANTFSETGGAAFIELVPASCSYTKSATTLKVYFALYIEWGHTNEADNDLKLTTTDAYGASDVDTYDVNYDYWAVLDVSGLTVNDGAGTGNRGNLDGAYTLSGTVFYMLGPGTTYPDSGGLDIVDVWVSQSDYGSHTGPWSDLTLTSGVFSLTGYYDDAVGSDTISVKVVAQDAGSGGSEKCHATHTTTCIADRVAVTLTITYSKIGVGQNCSGLLASGIYQYDSTAFDGSFVLNSSVFSYATAGYRGYTTGSLSGDTYGVTTFTTNSLTILWQNVTCTWSHFWTKYSDALWFAHLDLSDLKWSLEGTTLPTGATILFFENSSLFDSVASSGGLASAVEDYGLSWRYVVWALKLTYLNAPYNVTTLLFYTHAREAVPVVHTLYVEVWDLDFTDLYLYVTVESNWHNATLTIWDNTSLVDYFSSEGVCQMTLSTIAGLHRLVLLVNGSSPHAIGTYDASFPGNDKWAWRFLNYTVSLTATTMHLNLYMADGSPIFYPWGFKVYINGHRLDTTVYTTTAATVNLTITDLWNATMYQNLVQPVAEFLDIVTQTYWLTFTNQRDYSVNCTIIFNSRNYTIPDGIGPGGGFIRRLYTGSYTMYVYRADTGTLEPGFPVTKSVVGNWQVYTEKTIPGTTENTGGGLTVLSPWVPVLLMLVVGFGALSVYEWQHKKRP